MSQKVKIGVFGAGRGKSMIDVLAKHPDAELVAVCDKYAPLLEPIRKISEEINKPIFVYQEFDEFVKHDMDAVILANFAHEHAPYAIKLLNAGKHVMSEVLPTETMAQAVELVEAVEKSGKIYAYAENYCYMDQTFEMQRRYQNGEIGEALYLESEYLHDCSRDWPGLTYGDKEHWRNLLYSTFYCTHSVGPLLTITGLRPVSVVGFETPKNPKEAFLGRKSGFAGGMEVITLENKAIAKSIHGGLKREPAVTNFDIYATDGNMETNGKMIDMYIEKKGSVARGVNSSFEPEKFISPDLAKNFGGHGGSDFYATHFFIEKILGREDGKFSIDIYTALDMSFCGIMAYRSILAGNQPMAIPNFRNKEEREPFRHDNKCTNTAIASGDDLLPCHSSGDFEISDDEYEKVKELWLAGKKAE